jgi:hypothetical protein
MNPELSLCKHLSGLRAGDAPPELAHALLWQDGAIDAVVRCARCGAHALLRLLDWAPPHYALRVYSLAALRAEDSALFLRNLERGSCQVARAGAELDALVAAAGPSERLIALDLARDRVAASAPLPEAARGEPDAFPARLPREDDARWFAALGLEKRAAGASEAGAHAAGQSPA